jgi:hypothetical protein
MRSERVAVSAASRAVASKTAGYLGMSPTASAGISVCGCGGPPRRQPRLQHVHGREQGIALDRPLQQDGLTRLAIEQPQRWRGGHAALGGFLGLGADERIGPLARQALLDGRRRFGIAQAIGQALAVAARVGIDPFDGLPEGGMPARFGGALGQACLGRRGRLVRGQRLVVPLQGHVGVVAHPALELREVLPAERTFQVGIERQREAAFGVAHLPGRPGHLRSVLTGADGCGEDSPGDRDTSQISSSATSAAAKTQGQRFRERGDGTPGLASEWKDVSVPWHSPAIAAGPRPATRCRAPGRSSRPP